MTYCGQKIRIALADDVRIAIVGHRDQIYVGRENDILAVIDLELLELKAQARQQAIARLPDRRRQRSQYIVDILGKYTQGWRNGDILLAVFKSCSEVSPVIFPEEIAAQGAVHHV